MDVQFNDRILTCSDCSGDFIFTAGEQLFFFDKQFKNDPKRCKPCKSRRCGLSAAANGTGPAAAGLARTETRTDCSECGINTTVPFKPTQGRPVLCRQCFQERARAARPAVSPGAALPGTLATHAPPGQPTDAHTIAALTSLSANHAGLTLSSEAALLALSSMSSASLHSSVATASDLASIAALKVPHSRATMQIPTELVAASTESLPAELVAAAGETPKA